MATGVTSWSQTAASNANSDSTVNWAEGQAPSSVNDSARAVMASVAKYRDDTSGSIITGGTSTAYTVTSNQGFASKSAMNGAEIAVTIHSTNGATPTLNVDSLGADPIIIDTSSGTTPVPSGTLLTGGVYTLVYYNSGNTWRLKDFYQLPFTVPVGGMIDYFGTSAPSTNFVFPFGQAISRTTYSLLFSMFGTTFGTGDGSTTFNVPDLRGRIIAGKDDMGGSAASRLSATSITSGGPTTLGGTGGADTKTLVTANLPAYTPSGSVSVTTIGIRTRAGNALASNDASAVFEGNTSNTISNPNNGPIVQPTASFAGTAQGGTSTAFSLAQPTIIANKLLRII